MVKRSQKSRQCRFQIRNSHASCSSSGDHHNVHAGWKYFPLALRRRPDFPPQAIPLNRPTKLPSNRYANPAGRRFVPAKVDDQHVIGVSGPFALRCAVCRSGKSADSFNHRVAVPHPGITLNVGESPRPSASHARR